MNEPTPLLVAVTGAAEARLVTVLEGARGLIVVRRCADLVELLAASAAGHGRVALVSGDLHRLDAVAVAALHDAGTAVVGVRVEQDDGDRLTAIGVDALLDADAPVDTVAAAVVAALEASRASVQQGTPGPDDAAGDAPEPVQGWRPSGAAAVTGRSPRGGPTGARARVIAVWGPPGAPGRTMVATSVASALAARGRATLLVDADTTAASVALGLGLLDESAGLAAACRSAAEGRLDAERLQALAPTTAPHLRVLTGLPRASRWPEVGEVALATVLEVARARHDVVVVDCAASVEEDEELSYDTRAPRRNAATVTTLRHADEVLVVGAGDPVGLQRLVRALSDLSEVAPEATARVVVTQVRASAVGPSPQRQVTETLARYAGVDDPSLLPDDRAGYDAALLAGRSVVEAGGSSPLRRALLDLAATLDRSSSAGRRRTH